MFKRIYENSVSQKTKRTVNIIKEKFHHIQTNLQFSRTLDNQILKTIVVTSGIKGEGKSFCVWNLGKSLVANNRRVLLIDGDMYKANLSKKLNVFDQSGLSDILISDKDPMEFIVETIHPNLFILPTGILPPNPIELINSDRMHEIIKFLEERFDMVIFDTPPVLLLSDSRIIGSMCNGVIVIIRSGLTKRKDLEATMELLKQANIHVLGTILNGKNYGRNEMNSYFYY